MYQKIYDFCKVRNSGSVYKNGNGTSTNRVKWIINLLKSNNIDFIIDEFNLSEDNKCWNIILPGDSKMSVCAHHDIVNPNSDNAFNDSVIFRRNKIDSCVINPLPIINKETSIINKDGQYLDVSMLYNCHSMEDSVETICASDMKDFVEKIALNILK